MLLFLQYFILFTAGAHGIHNLPCATKLRLWMGYQCLASIDVPAESYIWRCDVETLFFVRFSFFAVEKLLLPVFKEQFQS